MLRIQIQGDPQGISPFGNPELVPGVPDDRKLTGPMVGHFVCVDGFGSPSKEEQRRDWRCTVKRTCSPGSS